mgnify:CR=1 FL=1
MKAPVEARKLLHRGGFEVPIDLQVVCEYLGLKLLIGDLDTLDGLFLAKQGGGMGIIVVNEHRCRARKRFTIAHEIGHAVLNHFSISFSDGNGLNNSSWQERQANAFAAELLMPRDFLLANGPMPPEDIKKHCIVSMDAAKFRAINLGWIPL